MKAILIYPPMARSTEAPLGIARLASTLRSAGKTILSLDLNQEAQEWLLGLEPEEDDTWTHGARKRRDANLALIRSPQGYEGFDRYSRAVRDLNRHVRSTGRAAGASSPGGPPIVGLADYGEAGRSPLRRADLLDSGARPGTNPFHGLFARRLEDAMGELGEASGEGREVLIGFSVVYLSQALSAFAMAGHVRRRWPRATIVMGGGLVTSWLGQGLVDADEDFGGLFDHLVPGRGEEGLAALMGVASPCRPEAAPDFADFEGLAYLAPGRVLPYAFSTGCPWRKCEFCPERSEGQAYAPKRVEEAMDDLEALARRWSPVLFHFMDNEVAPLYMRAITRRPTGVPWYGFARFSTALEDPGFCRDLAEAGCAMLQLGLESGDQKVLDAMGKGTKVESIRRILRNLGEVGIGSYVYVLFGTPEEDHEAARRTRDFLAEEAANIGWLNLAIFNMPATSPMAASFATRQFYDGDLSIYSEFAHPEGWNRSEIRAFIRDELEAEPALRAIMRRTPPVFTSNHAAFFVGRG